MACDTMVKTSAERRAREAALEQLRDDLESGRRRIARNALTGEISITGWARTAAASAKWCEGCAIRAMESRGWASRALAAAGVKRGQKFVAASHNGHPH